MTESLATAAGGAEAGTGSAPVDMLEGLMSDGGVSRLSRRYSRQARAYRKLWDPVLRAPGEKLVRRLRGPRVESVVDIGTGIGTLLPVIGEIFPRATILGVDRSLGMLKLAPRGVALAAMDASELGIATASIDLVILAFVLFHLPDPLRGLCEVRRGLCEECRASCGRLRCRDIRR